ncbi:hypothetical protein DICSQDRAFT_155904 [Dichomitus squalens LYAD-421 SS1]|uniref:Uncharacterized protein n=1 Tax=Dichomitus squalens (strain LYAD-421) TaxID=732165 RepID=R7SYW4_DICSQ|nr:uncharacterized protein DICSQDRAFT_155904 [Dichomitus squalens LYAD-421 SS1]EJF60152.1 hypothetical protein DICSQDRAFT_155904 [Dichomitus squalens LYAD-421 SS1]
MPRRLSPAHHYIRFGVSPPCTDPLTIRKGIQDALGQSFGLVSSHTYLDIIWLADDGTALVVRIGPSDAPKLLAAVAAASAVPRLSLVKKSTFLPSLLSTAGILS